MNAETPHDNPDAALPSASNDAEFVAAEPESTGRNIQRALVVTVSSAIVGLLLGLCLWWLTTMVWSLWESSWPPAVRRRSGGDPIDNWARGITRIFFLLAFIIPTGAVGFGIGIRLALSKALTRQEYLTELRRCRRDAVRFIFGQTNRFGNISLVAGLGALIVLDAGFRARNLIPVALAIPTVLVLVTLGFCTGIRGLRQKPMTTATCGLVLTAYVIFLFVSAVYQVGLEGILEAWL